MQFKRRRRLRHGRRSCKAPLPTTLHQPYHASVTPTIQTPPSHTHKHTAATEWGKKQRDDDPRSCPLFTQFLFVFCFPSSSFNLSFLESSFDIVSFSFFSARKMRLSRLPVGKVTFPAFVLPLVPVLVHL